MAFQVNCDRCGRFMANVSAQNIKAIIKTSPLCKPCIEAEENLQKEVSTIKRKAEVAFKRLSDKYKSMLTEAVQKQVDNGDTD